MTILILGGTGYLGGKLINTFLKKKGVSVICIRRPSSNLSRLPAENANLSFCDIGNLENTLKTAGGSIEWFVNMSCRYCKKGISDLDIWDANFIVPLKCMLLCAQYGIKRYLTIDTGLPSGLNVYCKAKEELSIAGQYYAKMQEIEFCNILLELYYGEDEPSDRFLSRVVDSLKKGEDVLLTEGDQKRDFIYVDDVVRNLIGILETEYVSGYREIPLGSGEAPTIREVITYLHDQAHSHSALRFGAVPKRKNEPDSVADRKEMQKHGIHTEYTWKNGMLRLIKESKGEQKR